MAVLDLAVHFPVLSVTPRLVRGPLVEVLEAASLEASLLVVGRPAGSDVAAGLTGMAGALAVRAHCPLLVVRTSVPAGADPAGPGPSYTLEDPRSGDAVTGSGDGPVVVAVDQSPAGRAALGWAVGYARAVGADLHAVHVLTGDVAVPVSVASGLLSTPEPLRARIRTSLRGLFDSTTPEPSWTMTFLEGPPGRAIVEHARGARVLVVGARQHRGVGRLLLASVSHYCLSHADCPVVAVPAPHGGRTEALTASGAGDGYPAPS